MSKIEFFSNEYNSKYWESYVSCFDKSDLHIDGIPQDIVNVVVKLLGENIAVEWLNKPLSSLDNMTALELVKSEKGCQALKAFILRIPN